MSESSLQQQVLKWLKRKKIYYINIHGGGWGAKGAPDVIVCYKGKFVAFELKVGKNDMQDDQKIHMNRIIKSGGLHFVPRTFKEFLKIMEDL